MIEISIIIPNYNHGTYFDQRLQSVMQQTFRDFEVIILDDCSTDDSRGVIEKYSNHEKISHIIFNEQNSGSTFKQWQKGIELAKGKFIWIAESDDWCEPTFLETLYAGISTNESCIVAFCQSCCTDGSKILWTSQSPYLSEYKQGTNFINERMITGNAIFNASMAIWRKSAFENISKDFLEFRFCGDWLFWIELCLNGNVFISGKVLNYFRKHNKDVSGKVYQTGYNFLEEIKLIDILVRKNYITKELYLVALKEKFNRFIKAKQNLQPEASSEIEKEFFRDRATKKHLINKVNFAQKVVKKISTRLK